MGSIQLQWLVMEKCFIRSDKMKGIMPRESERRQKHKEQAQKARAIKNASTIADAMRGDNNTPELIEKLIRKAEPGLTDEEYQNLAGTN